MFEFKRKGTIAARSDVSNRIYAKWYLSLGCYCIITCCLLFFMTSVQNKHYMDEICHIPQLESYCKGNFDEWDHRITTPPGLYLFTLSITWPLSKVLQNPEVCSDVSWVRGTVAMSGILIPFLTFSILRLLHGVTDEKGATTFILLSFTSAVFPLLYFFNFLYYTDVLSTVLVLMTFWLYLRESYTKSAFIGVLSLFLRQTNIMWIFFCAILTIFRVLRQRSHRDFSPSVVVSTKYFSLLWTQTWNNSLKNWGAFQGLVADLSRNLWAYATAGALFITFVIVNGGIVLGDKAAHEPVLHFPQALYFCSFTLFFTSPLMLSKWRSFLCSLRHRYGAIVIGGALAFVMIRYFTMAHPYLLSDNRHYTFYLWRWVINRSWWTRYALIPIHLLGALWIQHLLQDTDIIFRLAWLLCTVVCLVPQRLMEFRYYIIPFLLLRLHYTRATRLELLLEILLYIVVNAVTIYLFATKSIRWPNEEDDQRIMW